MPSRHGEAVRHYKGACHRGARSAEAISSCTFERPRGLGFSLSRCRSNSLAVPSHHVALIHE